MYIVSNVHFELHTFTTSSARFQIVCEEWLIRRFTRTNPELVRVYFVLERALLSMSPELAVLVDAELLFL